MSIHYFYKAKRSITGKLTIKEICTIINEGLSRPTRWDMLVAYHLEFLFTHFPCSFTPQIAKLSCSYRFSHHKLKCYVCDSQRASPAAQMVETEESNTASTTKYIDTPTSAADALKHTIGTILIKIPCTYYSPYVIVLHSRHILEHSTSLSFKSRSIHG